MAAGGSPILKVSELLDRAAARHCGIRFYAHVNSAPFPLIKNINLYSFIVLSIFNFLQVTATVKFLRPTKMSDINIYRQCQRRIDLKTCAARSFPSMVSA
jgi:hypothetical protein